MPIDVAETGADITLASTTETQAELDHATSENWRQKFDPAKAAATDGANKDGKTTEEATDKDKKDATKTGAGSDPAKTEVKPGDETDDEKNLPPGAKKRIDKLTKKLRQAEEELATARRGEKQPTARETVQPAKAAPNADPEPKVKDFKTYEEYQDAHTRWAVRDESRKEAAKAAEAQQTAEAKENYDAHLTRVQSFASEHDDFESSVKEMGKFEFASAQSNIAFQLAIVEADNGPDIMYHLAKNPDEMAKFEGLSPAKVTMLIGRLSAKLTPETTTDADDKKDKDGKDKTSSTTQSKAPPPGTAVRRSTAAPATRLDDPKMSTDDFIRMRNAQEAKNRRR